MKDEGPMEMMMKGKKDDRKVLKRTIFKKGNEEGNIHGQPLYGRLPIIWVGWEIYFPG
jgi:hypothetical protein